MITPRWVTTRCQPIAVDDVIAYLAGCLADERTSGRTFDIGGPEVLTYKEMMERFGRIEGQKPLHPAGAGADSQTFILLGRSDHPGAAVGFHAVDRGAEKRGGLSGECDPGDHSAIRLTPYDEAVRKALAKNLAKPINNLNYKSRRRNANEEDRSCTVRMRSA